MYCTLYLLITVTCRSLSWPPPIKLASAAYFSNQNKPHTTGVLGSGSHSSAAQTNNTIQWIIEKAAVNSCVWNMSMKWVKEEEIRYILIEHSYICTMEGFQTTVHHPDISWLGYQPACSQVCRCRWLLNLGFFQWEQLALCQELEAHHILLVQLFAWMSFEICLESGGRICRSRINTGVGYDFKQQWSYIVVLSYDKHRT